MLLLLNAWRVSSQPWWTFSRNKSSNVRPQVSNYICVWCVSREAEKLLLRTNGEQERWITASREETTGRRVSVLVYRSVRLRVCILTTFYEVHKEKMVMQSMTREKETGKRAGQMNCFLHKHVPSCTTKQEGPDSVQIQHGFHRLSSRTLNEPYSDTQTNRVSCLLCWCAREIILFITFYFSSSFCFFLCFFLFLSDLSVVMHQQSIYTLLTNFRPCMLYEVILSLLFSFPFIIFHVFEIAPNSANRCSGHFPARVKLKTQTQDRVGDFLFSSLGFSF